MKNNDKDFVFSERSGQYKVTPASRHSLSSDLQSQIHDEAVKAYRDGKTENENPYSIGCPAYLQWEHSFSEYQEACED